MNSSTGSCSSTLTVEVVPRQSYPHVPPELLLKEHAGNFRLTNLTLTSLVEAVSPRVTPVLPPKLSRNEKEGGTSNEFVRTLLKETALRPPVPRENIKKPFPYTRQLEREADEAKRRAKTASQLPFTTANSKASLGVEEEDGSFVFQELTSSYLTAVALLRVTSSGNTRTREQNCPKKGNADCDRVGLGSHNPNMEEKEFLWGYSTGAVVHVTLRPYAADLKAIKEHKNLPPPRRRFSVDEVLETESKEDKEDILLNTTRTFGEQGNSSTDINDILQSYNDALQDFAMRAPRGVSLLGYHPIGSVCSLVYDARNDLAISGGSDGSILMWDVHHRYRGVLRERYIHDEDMRGARATQQFGYYICTRRLTQRLSHAHDGAISSLAIHCELLLSGGMDGVVKIWSNMRNSGLFTEATLPEYFEQQVFNCHGWVRQIWCAPERNVQGEDIWVACENGGIIGFKGFTLSQQPVITGPRNRSSILLEQLCRKAICPMDMGITQKPAAGEDINKMPTFPSVSGVRQGSTGSGRQTFFNPKTSSEKRALRLFQRGVISRALCLTRKLQTLSEEARLAGSIRSGVRLKESTSSLTKLIPLTERNLFITVGYSPVVRFLDMTRLSVAAVVEHPSRNAASTAKKGGDAQSSLTECYTEDQQNGQNNPMGNKLNIPATAGDIKGVKALRFTDVLYVTSHDYLLLLDNRNTIFVWDNVENKLLTSWRAPEVSECGRKNIALWLFPCGTRHYDGTTYQYMNWRQNSRSGVPERRKSCHFEQLGGMETFNKTEGTSETKKIPFFLICNLSIELCEVVIDTQARIEFQAHKDVILGMFLYQSYTYPLNAFEKIHQPAPLGTVPAEPFTTLINKNKLSGHDLTGIVSNEIKALQIGKSHSVNHDTEILNDSLSDWMQEYLEKADGGERLYAISCSVDGVICFWGHSFELLRVYHHKGPKVEDTDLFTTVSHKPFFSDSATSPFDVPPRKIRKQREGSIVEMHNSGSDDVTSFHFSPRWQLIVTGHDDGSIRFWPCDMQVGQCVWHRGLHRNTVSGLAEARILEQEKKQLSRARLGSLLSLTGADQPTELLSTISFDGYLAVWEYPEQKRIHLRGRTRVSNNELLCIVFDSINELFIVGDNGGVISSWHARNLEPCCCVPSSPPPPWRPLVAPSLFSKPSGMKDNSAKPPVWQRRENNKHQQEETHTIGHTEAVTVLFMDGNFVFSGGEDGRVFLWDLHNGKLIREYFLLHDAEEVAQHSKTLVSNLKVCSLEVRNNRNERRFTVRRFENTNKVTRRMENVTSIVLLKQRGGNFLVSTREGWVYHFEQNQRRPRSVYKHSSSVMCMCLLKDGGANGKILEFDHNCEVSVDTFSFFGIHPMFKVAIADEFGKIAVIQEAYFVDVG